MVEQRSGIPQREPRMHRGTRQLSERIPSEAACQVRPPRATDVEVPTAEHVIVAEGLTHASAPAETHRVAKSEILERALVPGERERRSTGRPVGLATGVEQPLVSPSRARPRHSNRVDSDIRALLLGDYATDARERARGGAGARSTPVRPGDRGCRQTPSDRSKLVRAGRSDPERDPTRREFRRPATGC